MLAQSTKAGEARRLRCPSCGAPAPLLAGAICAYCLEPIPVPPDMGEPLAAHAALGRQLEAARQRFAAARRRARGPQWLALLIGAAIGVIGAAGIAGPLAFMRNQPSMAGGAMLSVSLATIAYGGLVAGFGAGVLRGMRNARLRLAALPFVALDATDRLEVSCPTCGAAVVSTGEAIAVRCDHCTTRSLLPAAFVPERLQAKHARILQLRTRYTDVKDIAESTTSTVNESVGIAMVTIGVLGFLLFVYLSSNPDFAPHLGGTERVMAVVCSGGTWLAIFGGGGVLGIRNARPESRG